MPKKQIPIPFRVEVDHPDRDTTILTVTGEVDEHTVREYLNEQVETISSAKRKVIIDLQAVTYFSAAGISWLIRMVEKIDELGKKLVIEVMPQGIVDKIFGVTNTYQFFDIKYAEA